MNGAARHEDLKTFTDAEIKEIADCMVEPLRMSYENGKSCIWFGGIAYPYDEFHQAYKDNHCHWPEEWCRKWREDQVK